ncbi:MAG: hypothetical protein GXO22_07865 [Aquificae bacterium]|nr:hypothetical protein [Aquificota bacterium]
MIKKAAIFSIAILTASILTSCSQKVSTYDEKRTYYLVNSIKKKVKTLVYVYRDDGIRGVSKPVNCFLDENFIGVLNDETFLIVPAQPGAHLIYCGINVPTHGASYSDIKIFRINKEKEVFIKVSQGGLIVPTLSITREKSLPSEFFYDFKLSKACVFCLKY